MTMTSTVTVTADDAHRMRAHLATVDGDRVLINPETGEVETIEERAHRIAMLTAEREARVEQMQLRLGEFEGVKLQGREVTVGGGFDIDLGDDRMMELFERLRYQQGVTLVVPGFEDIRITGVVHSRKVAPKKAGDTTTDVTTAVVKITGVFVDEAAAPAGTRPRRGA